MQVITIAIQKGGVGKTTTAATLANAAVYAGKKVLCIDLDPQGNLSYTLGARTGANVPGSMNLLNGTPAADVIQPIRKNMDVIPANWELSTITTSTGSARRLQRAIEPLKTLYDLIVIDTPPTAGELQYNAMQAATGLIIPLQADVYSVQSLYQITDTAKAIQQTNKDLKILGYILTQFDPRSVVVRRVHDLIDQNAQTIGTKCLGTVRSAVAVKEAALLQESLFDYAPKSKPAADYMAIYQKIEEEN